MITIISDTHDKYEQYYKIASQCDFSVQIGDFGNSSYTKLLYSDLDPQKHKIISGNHCNYDIAPDIPHYLGDYGMANVGGVDFFFVRGGISIDRVYRVGEELNGGPKTWWSQEELNFSQMIKCLELYSKLKPDIVLSHVPCGMYSEHILGNKSDAILQKFKFHAGFKENHQLLGNEMLKAHKPQMWVSAHMHRSFQGIIDGVKVIGLAELETYEINL